MALREGRTSEQAVLPSEVCDAQVRIQTSPLPTAQNSPSELSSPLAHLPLNYFILGLHSSPHALTMTPFPFLSPPPSSISLNATANLVPSALKSSAEIGEGYLGNWRSRFLARGSQMETVQSPPPVANVPCLGGGVSSCGMRGRKEARRTTMKARAGGRRGEGREERTRG